MKKLFITIGVALLCIDFASTAFAQSTATGNSNATIIQGILINKNNDMAFGNVATDETAGTVILSPLGVRTTTGGATAPSTAGSVTPAVFTVTGAGNFTFAITLPSAQSVYHAAGTAMTIDQFTSYPASTGVLAAGSTQIAVGATLNMPANTYEGYFVSTLPFPITVNYN